MAITQNTYTGNGSTVLFSFTFPYLETTDIKVSVNGTVTTAYTLANATTIQFNTAPVNGAAIRIYRQTDDSATAATFYPGSAIRSQDLNDNFTQNLYVTQEVNNNAVDIDGSNPMAGNLNMGGFQIDNLAQPTADNDAATKKYIDDRYGATTIPAYTRWRKTATAGQTTFSGTGEYGGTLAYSSLREQVYLNGVLQQRSADYTADNETSIVFAEGLTVGDVVDVVCINNTNTSGISTAANLSYSGQFTGQTTRTVAAKLADVVSVKDFGAVGDGVADDTAAIQAAIDSFAPYSAFTAEGGNIYLPPGRFKLTASLDLTGKHGLALIGSGVLSTEIFASGNYPVISSVNTSATPWNDGCIRDMTIRGGGNTNANAHGIYTVFTNGCTIENIAIYSCKYGLNLNHSWQFDISNVDAHGGTTDRCDIGVYMGPTTLTNIDNAVTAYNITVKDCITAGFRIVNGQGSKFVSCEAGAMPIGWHIGEPSTGTVLCQWLHVEGCLADSNSTCGWRIAKGSATELSQMQFSNCWSGNSADNLVFIANANDIVFSNWQLVRATNHGIYAENCSKLQWNNFQLLRFNEANTGKQGIYCSGTTRCTFAGIVTPQNAFTKSSFLEAAGSNINVFDLDTSESGTLIGVDSRNIRTDTLQGGGALTQTIQSTGDQSAYHKYDNNTNSWIAGITSNAGGNYYVFAYNGSQKLFFTSTAGVFPNTNDTGSIGVSGNRFANGYINKYFVAASSANWSGGNNSPEGVVTAPVGSLYSRLDGGTGTTLYVKESGTGNIGWVAK